MDTWSKVLVMESPEAFHSVQGVHLNVRLQLIMAVKERTSSLAYFLPIPVL